jgi:Tfp pilus assembly protein PilF
MKNFRKVTILGILIGFSGSLFGCVAGEKERMQHEQEIERQAEAREAAEIKALLSACRGYIEQGESDRARRILQEVLHRRPDHPQALFYWEKLNTPVYSTVYPGDTLSGIAAYYYGDGEKWSVLARANGIQSPEKLDPYHRLRIPWMPGCEEGKDEVGRIGRRMFGNCRPVKIVLHPVGEGDSLETLARQYYRNRGLRFFLADYNRIEDPRSLEKGSSLRIPVFPPRKVDTTRKDRAALKRGYLAMKKRKYEEACRYFGSVPRGSACRKEARGSMERCRMEGAAHYEKLGDEALRNAEPKDACRYWKTALQLDPGRKEVEKKLEEARDLVKALDLLPSLR